MQMFPSLTSIPPGSEYSITVSSCVQFIITHMLNGRQSRDSYTVSVMLLIANKLVGAGPC